MPIPSIFMGFQWRTGIYVPPVPTTPIWTGLSSAAAVNWTEDPSTSGNFAEESSVPGDWTEEDGV